jgi:hypothetical protein
LEWVALLTEEPNEESIRRILAIPAKGLDDGREQSQLRRDLHAINALAGEVYFYSQDERRLRHAIMKLRQMKEDVTHSMANWKAARNKVDLIEMEEAVPTITTPPEFGVNDYVPHDVRKQFSAWSGDKKDKYDIFMTLRKIYKYASYNDLTAQATIECMRRIFEGEAAATLHRICPEDLNEDVTFQDVVRALESTFGGLMDHQLAKNRLYNLTREPKETIRAMYIRAMRLAEMGVRMEPKGERHKRANELVEPIIIKAAKWEHQKRLEDGMKTRRLAGLKPMRLDGIVQLLEEMENEEQRNPRSDTFVGLTTEHYHEMRDMHEHVMRIVEGDELRKRKEELRARHPSVTRRVDFVGDSRTGAGFRRGESRSPGRRGSSREGRGPSGDRRGGRDDRRRSRTPTEEVRYASDRRGSADSRQSRGPSADRRDNNNTERFVRRPSKSPSAYTGAKIDPQELGVSVGSCFRCGSKKHMANSTECPYAGLPISKRCGNCWTGGHPTESCTKLKARSGN